MKMGSDILTNAAGMFNAVAYYVKAAISLIVSNPVLLGGSAILLLTVGKSVKLGRIASYKG